MSPQIKKRPRPTRITFENPPLNILAWPLILVLTATSIYIFYSYEKNLSVLALRSIAEHNPDYLLTKPDDHHGKLGSRFYKGSNQHSDAILLGTSFVREAFSEDFYLDNKGQETYLDLSSSSQSSTEALFLLESYSPPKFTPIIWFVSPKLFLETSEDRFSAIQSMDYLIDPSQFLSRHSKDISTHQTTSTPIRFKQLAIAREGIKNLIQDKLYSSHPPYDRYMKEIHLSPELIKKHADRRAKSTQKWPVLFEGNLIWVNKLINYAKLNGSPLILVYQPMNPEYASQVYGPVREDFKHTLSTLANNNPHVTYYDFSNCLLNCKKEYFRDSIHFNVHGRNAWTTTMNEWLPTVITKGNRS